MVATSSGTGTIAAEDTLMAFEPRCVLIVGLAMGLGDLNLGDVVVADRICTYESGKVVRGLHSPPRVDISTDAALTSAARTLAVRQPVWYGELDQPDELRHLSPRIVVGEVGSVDRVVADDPADPSLVRIMRDRPELRAVAMEGADAAAAVLNTREMHRTVSFGMICGISDLSFEDGAQSSRQVGQSVPAKEHDSWRLRASATAAAAAVQLIRLTWPWPPQISSNR